MKVWMANLAPGTSAEKVKHLLEKYGLPEPTSVLPILDGAEPAMLVEFRTEGFDDMQKLRELIWRVEGLYWEGKHIVVTTLHH